MGGKLKKAPEGARNSVYGEKQCRTFVFLLVLGVALLLCIYIILKALKVNDYVENK